MTSLLRVFAIGAALLAVGPAFAQGYPEQGVKIVVGFRPGVAPPMMGLAFSTIRQADHRG